MLISNLQKAGIDNLNIIEDMVVKIHLKNPNAIMDEWLMEMSMINAKFQSFMSAVPRDDNIFDFDVVMKLFILQHIPTLLDLELYWGVSQWE